MASTLPTAEERARFDLAAAFGRVPASEPATAERLYALLGEFIRLLSTSTWLDTLEATTLANLAALSDADLAVLADIDPDSFLLGDYSSIRVNLTNELGRAAAIGARASLGIENAKAEQAHRLRQRRWDARQTALRQVAGDRITLGHITFSDIVYDLADVPPTLPLASIPFTVATGKRVRIPRTLLATWPKAPRGSPFALDQAPVAKTVGDLRRAHRAGWSLFQRDRDLVTITYVDSSISKTVALDAVWVAEADLASSIAAHLAPGQTGS